MTDHPRHTEADLEAFLSGASIDAAVAVLRPDYRALLITVDGLDPHADQTGSEALLVRAEETARDLLAETTVEELPHVAAWRDAYRAFGAKPQRTRNSLEALTRRADPVGSGLPRVNALTDLYNAISVIHQVPLGGENLAAYAGSPRLTRAAGDEPFDTTANGQTVVEHPDAGEVVWCDDTGVTCRRWNWRQGRRTQLTDETTSALFILDALGAMTDDALAAAGDELVTQLRQLGNDVRVATRLLTPLVTTSTLAQEHP
jgi:DNA/RNA-binding domain of Phe-tRNA-synthetase-like protein